MNEKCIAMVHYTLDSRDCDIFEIEDTDLRKYALRVSYNKVEDLCIVVDETGFVRTVWLNRKTDNHRTLDKSQYTRPTK